MRQFAWRELGVCAMRRPQRPHRQCRATSDREHADQAYAPVETRSRFFSHLKVLRRFHRVLQIRLRISSRKCEFISRVISLSYHIRRRFCTGSLINNWPSFRVGLRVCVRVSERGAIDGRRAAFFSVFSLHTDGAGQRASGPRVKISSTATVRRVLGSR